MFRISNTKKYNDMVFTSFVVALLMSVVIYLWKGGPIAAYTISFLLFAIAMLSRRFTKSVEVDSCYINIEYIRWFISRVIKIEIKRIKTQLGKEVANRAGSTYITIEFHVDNKVVYTVSSNDGFDENDLIDFASRIEQVKTFSLKE